MVVNNSRSCRVICHHWFCLFQGRQYPECNINPSVRDILVYVWILLKSLRFTGTPFTLSHNSDQPFLTYLLIYHSVPPWVGDPTPPSTPPPQPLESRVPSLEPVPTDVRSDIPVRSVVALPHLSLTKASSLKSHFLLRTLTTVLVTTQGLRGHPG